MLFPEDLSLELALVIHGKPCGHVSGDGPLWRACGLDNIYYLGVDDFIVFGRAKRNGYIKVQKNEEYEYLRYCLWWKPIK